MTIDDQWSLIHKNKLDSPANAFYFCNGNEFYQLVSLMLFDLKILVIFLKKKKKARATLVLSVSFTSWWKDFLSVNQIWKKKDILLKWLCEMKGMLINQGELITEL